MNTNQHTEEKPARAKMAACGWGGWDLNSRLFAIKRLLWIDIYTVKERTTISTPFTRFRVILDWPHDIYTLRGPPVARDRGSAQWQVFCCGKEAFKSIFIRGLRYLLFGFAFQNDSDLVTRVLWYLGDFNDPPGVETRPRHLEQSWLAT